MSQDWKKFSWRYYIALLKDEINSYDQQWIFKIENCIDKFKLEIDTNWPYAAILCAVPACWNWASASGAVQLWRDCLLKGMVHTCWQKCNPDRSNSPGWPVSIFRGPVRLTGKTSHLNQPHLFDEESSNIKKEHDRAMKIPSWTEKRLFSKSKKQMLRSIQIGLSPFLWKLKWYQ